MTTPARRRVDWVFCDTSAYYAAAAQSDDNHAAALSVLRRLERERVRFFTTLYVLAELHALVITRHRDPRRALALLRSIESGSTTVVPVDTDDHARARAVLALQQDKLYSLTDALSFVIMERLGISRAFTFDHNFEQYGFTMLMPEH
jgi:predicted nucleic acid-binding protein